MPVRPMPISDAMRKTVGNVSEERDDVRNYMASLSEINVSYSDFFLSLFLSDRGILQSSAQVKDSTLLNSS